MGDELIGFAAVVLFLSILLAFLLISGVEANTRIAAELGLIPGAIGIGYPIDATLVRRELRTDN